MCVLSQAATIFADANFHYYGTIQDEEGNPIVGATIEVVDQTTSRVGSGTGIYLMTVTTDVNGTFSFYVDYGTYDLTIEKDGYITQTIRYNGVNVPSIDVGTVTLKRTISVTLPATALAASPGSVVTVNVQVSNGGSADETVELQAAVPDGWSATIKSDAGELKSLSLKAGASITLSLIVAVPADATSGEIDFTASGQASVTKTLTIVAEGDPASVASCTYPSKIVSPGSTASYKITITNPSGEAGVVSLKATGVLAGWGAYFLNDDKEEIDSVYVQASSTASVTLRVQVPSSTAIGTIDNLIVTAKLGDLSTAVLLTLKVEQRATTIELGAKYPSQSLELGVATVYPITLSIGSSELVKLSAEGVPEGWSVVFKTSDGHQVNSILLEADTTESINVEVTPSLSSSQGQYNFTILAAGEGEEGSLSLTADIVGSYSLAMSLDSLYLQTNAKSSEVVTVTVTNEGYSPLTNVELALSVPDGWTVAYTPLKITTLAPNEKTTFQLTVTVPEGASPKDYLVSVQATSSEASATTQTIRVTVEVESSWGIYGLVLLAAGAGVFVLLYKKLKRR
jgi:uncharacterized membrane protein